MPFQIIRRLAFASCTCLLSCHLSVSASSEDVLSNEENAHEKLLVRFSALTSDKATLEDQNKSLTDTINKQKEKIDKASIKITDLKNENQKMQILDTEKRDQINQQLQEINNLKGEINDYSNLNDAFSLQKIQLEESENSLKTQKKKNEELTKNTKEEMNKLNTQISELSSTIFNNNKNHISEKTKLSNKISTLEVQLTTPNKPLVKDNQDIQDLTSKIQRLKNKVHTLETTNSELKDINNKQEEDLNEYAAAFNNQTNISTAPMHLRSRTKSFGNISLHNLGGLTGFIGGQDGADSNDEFNNTEYFDEEDKLSNFPLLSSPSKKTVNKDIQRENEGDSSSVDSIQSEEEEEQEQEEEEQDKNDNKVQMSGSKEVTTLAISPKETPKKGSSSNLIITLLTGLTIASVITNIFLFTSKAPSKSKLSSLPQKGESDELPPRITIRP